MTTMANAELSAEIKAKMEPELFSVLKNNGLELKYIKALADNKLLFMKSFGLVGCGEKASALPLLHAALEIKEEDLAQSAALTGAWLEAHRRVMIIIDLEYPETYPLEMKVDPTDISDDEDSDAKTDHDQDQHPNDDHAQDQHLKDDHAQDQPLDEDPKGQVSSESAVTEPVKPEPVEFAIAVEMSKELTERTPSPDSTPIYGTQPVRTPSPDSTPIYEPTYGTQPSNAIFGQPPVPVQPNETAYGQPTLSTQLNKAAHGQPQVPVQANEFGYGQPSPGTQPNNAVCAQPPLLVQSNEVAIGQHPVPMQPNAGAYRQSQVSMQPDEVAFGQPSFVTLQNNDAHGQNPVPMQSNEVAYGTQPNNTAFRQPPVPMRFNEATYGQLPLPMQPNEAAHWQTQASMQPNEFAYGQPSPGTHHKNVAYGQPSVVMQAPPIPKQFNAATYGQPTVPMQPNNGVHGMPSWREAPEWSAHWLPLEVTMEFYVHLATDHLHDPWACQAILYRMVDNWHASVGAVPRSEGPACSAGRGVKKAPVKKTTVEKTTVILFNLRNAVTRKDLAQFVDQAGFAGKYDFIYVPYSQDGGSAGNQGYALLNLVDPAVALEFQQEMEGRCADNSSIVKPSGKTVAIAKSERPLTTKWARIQGLQEMKAANVAPADEVGVKKAIWRDQTTGQWKLCDGNLDIEHS